MWVDLRLRLEHYEAYEQVRDGGGCSNSLVKQMEVAPPFITATAIEVFSCVVERWIDAKALEVVRSKRCDSQVAL